MIDRIEQKDPRYYRIQETDPDRNPDEEDEGQDDKSFFEDKTDWRLLYNKVSHTTRSKTILSQDIDQILFHSVSLKNDPSVVEVTIVLKNKNRESPLFISIPRSLAFKFQHYERGHPLPKETICTAHHLQVMVPEAIVPSAVPPSLPEATSITLRIRHAYRARWQRILARFKQKWSWDIALFFSVCTMIILGVVWFIAYLI